jgi:hypothetical protein
MLTVVAETITLAVVAMPEDEAVLDVAEPEEAEVVEELKQQPVEAKSNCLEDGALRHHLQRTNKPSKLAVEASIGVRNVDAGPPHMVPAATRHQFANRLQRTSENSKSMPILGTTLLRGRHHSPTEQTHSGGG